VDMEMDFVVSFGGIVVLKIGGGLKSVVIFE
jgi:hypothetical protein